MRRRHVVVICRGGGGGGSVAAVARRQAEELSLRFDVTMISDRPAPNFRRPVTFLPIAPARFLWLRRFGHVARERAFARAARRALQSLAAERPVDFVLCHAHAVAALAAAPFERSSGAPFALVTHGDIFDRPPGTYDRRLTAFYRKVTPFAYRDATRVVALSPHMAELAVRGGADAGKVRVIPNGIDAEEFGLAESAAWTPPDATAPLRLLFVGRLSVEKGVDLLLEALAELRRQGVAARLQVIGDGPLADELDAQARRCGIADAVERLGALPRSRLAAHYLECHAVCVPSLSDPLPTVALEAARAGRAVVAGAVGGLPFIVREGVTGLLFAAGSVEELTAALLEIAGDRARLATMGKAARERAILEFSWSRLGARLAAEIESAIEPAGGPAIEPAIDHSDARKSG